MTQRTPVLVPVARGLRQRQTDAERMLWQHLRARRPGFKFRRQVPLAGFVVDFACMECKVVVEVDGSGHASAQGRASDAVRDQQLQEEGFRVMRFWNREVFEDVTRVLEQIHAVCASRSPSPCPSPIEGEGT